MKKAGKDSAVGLGHLLIKRRGKPRDAPEDVHKRGVRPVTHTLADGLHRKVPVPPAVGQAPAGRAYAVLVDVVAEVLVVSAVDDLRHVFAVRAHERGQAV